MGPRFRGDDSLMMLWGPLTRFGLAVAVAAAAIDQAAKLWLLFIYDLGGRGIVTLSLGLIIGGAIGNAIDRLAYGAVADFVLFHVTTESFSFKWYVFNLADVAIVAGVIGLLYETLMGSSAAKAP